MYWLLHLSTVSSSDILKHETQVLFIFFFDSFICFSLLKAYEYNKLSFVVPLLLKVLNHKVHLKLWKTEAFFFSNYFLVFCLTFLFNLLPRYLYILVPLFSVSHGLTSFFSFILIPSSLTCSLHSLF